MKDYDKTKEQLVYEISKLRNHCASLEIAVRERKQLETEIQDAGSTPRTLSKPCASRWWCWNSDLKILTANQSFYDTFKATPEETIGHFIYDLGNRQWDILSCAYS